MIKLGDRLDGRFLLEAVAGRGGMGVVYRAVDETTGGLVAVKVMLGLGATEVARFTRERRVLAELTHPGVVGYIAHGTTADERLFIAMEWLEGEDLAKRLARGALSVPDVLALARASAGALAAAHTRGVVHRDVKPSNLFLVGAGLAHVKVLDFGVAREPTHALTITSSSEILGTAGYMAPEQIDGSRHADARADVFALGSVLFECLAGERAFPGDHMLAVMAKVVCQEVPPLRTIRPDVPPALEALVARMLAKDPDARPADGRALAREVDALDESGASLSTPPPAPRTAATPHLAAAVFVILVELHAHSASDVTVTAADAARRRAHVWAIVSRFGADFARMASGALVVTLSGEVPAERVVGCALALREAFPASRIAVATSRAATLSGATMVGPAIDVAAALLLEGHPAEREGAVLLDVATSQALPLDRPVLGEGRTRALLPQS